MKRVLIILALLVSASASLSAQTSVACTATGYCGNAQSSTGTGTSGNANAAYGIPITVNAGFGVSELKVWVTNTGAGRHVTGFLVCDSNTSGSVIGNSSPCPTNNVVCSGGSQVPGADGTFTFSLAGCGALSTSARYWLMINNDNSGVGYETDAAATGTSYFVASTCCTVPASLTGSLSADGGNKAQIGVTLTSAATSTQSHFRFRNDDGSESAATWLANEDTNVTQPLSTATRLRMQVDTTSAIGSQQYQLEWKKSTDAAYRAVLTTAPSPVTVTYCASGCTNTAGPFVAPADVFSAVVECWGGGGAGARAAANSTPGGGGKGGSYAKVNAMPLTPGTSYTLSLGAGGVSLTPSNGGATTFTGDASTVCTAAGGVTPAISSLTGATTVNGTSVGDVINLGGNGANGSGTNAGGGGEAGGSAGVGNPGSGATGGSGAGDGGDGGNGRTASNGVGLPGTIPGGGGGGALRVSTTSNNGGAGAAGEVKITYTPTPAILINPSANIAAAAATATTAQLSVPNAHSFTAGRIADDTNPMPAITVASSNYSEFEWDLIAASPAVNGSIYTFRMTLAGTPFSSTLVTPQWTIGTAGLAAVPRLTLLGVGP